MSAPIVSLISARLIAHGLPAARLGDPSAPIANTEITVLPHVLVHCFDENDVRAIVRTARELDLPIAVRGGGYSPAGYGTATGAIVAELSGLDAIEVTAGGRVRIGGGVTAGALDAALDEHALALNLPIPSRAGVVGAALSGGIGVLLRTAGFISDQIVGARLVTGTGEVADADDELLWALRGGGGNFGVVLFLDVQARPLTRLHITQIVYSEDEVAAALAHYRDASAALPEEVTAVAMARPIPALPGIPAEYVRAPGLVLTLIDADTSGAAQRAEVFTAGPPALATRGFEATPRELRAIMERGFPATTFGADIRSGWADTLDDDDLAAIERIARTAPSPHSLFEVVRLGGAVDRGHGAAPGRGRHYLVNAMALWTDAADAPGARAWAAHAADIVRGIRDGDALIPGFVSRDESGMASATYGPAYERLAAVKARYDPDNLFRINLAIDPDANTTPDSHTKECMNMNVKDPVDVLVVGAGPVGLSAAIDLARRGRRVHVVEKRTAPSTQPRAHVINARTMEIFDQWGVADDIISAGLSPDLAKSFSWSTSMAADALATLDYVSEDDAEENSPSRLCSCPQDLIERTLLRKLAEFPHASIRFGEEVTSVAQHSDRVVCTIRDADGEHTREARYLIGADGANSTVRGLVDAGLERSAPLGRRVNIYFHHDLSAVTRDRPNILWFILSPDTSGIFIALDGRSRWVYSVEVDADTDIASLFTPEYCTHLLRLATGVADLRPEIESVLTWRVDMAIADKWRVGRVFLAGDSAHQFPPMGGFGMNSGIQDAHNLAWKLDAVLAGAAGDALLDSYAAERRAVSVFNANRSMENAVNQQKAAEFMADPNVLRMLAAPEGDEIRAIFAGGVAQQREEFHSQGQQFGFIYTSSAVIADGAPAPESTISFYAQSSHPGARAPYARLRQPDGTETTTLDSFAGRWTVLAIGDGWTHAAAAAAERIGIDIGRVPIAPQAFVDAEGHVAQRYGLGEGGAVLVRPDGHIAARWTAVPKNPDVALSEALVAVLGLERARV